MDKKRYSSPAIVVVDMEVSSMLAASANNKVNIYDDITDDDAKMSNMKDNPWTHEWY
jgi:hypothetical protein